MNYKDTESVEDLLFKGSRAKVGYTAEEILLRVNKQPRAIHKEIEQLLKRREIEQLVFFFSEDNKSFLIIYRRIS